MLQICHHLCRQYRVLYITGEESARQIKLRAVRLGVDSSTLYICATTDMSTVIATIDQVRPDLVMVDSIQTMSYHELNSAPGSVAQVRQSTQMLTASAKTSEIPIFIVGHVNKDGAIAGPKVLEHMVDAVLYFEGDRNQAYRILRAVKNRYGSTNEIAAIIIDVNGKLHNDTDAEIVAKAGDTYNVTNATITTTPSGNEGTYKVEVTGSKKATDEMTITVTPTVALDAEGTDTVTVTITYDTNKTIVKTFEFTQADGNNAKTATFSMPAYDISVSAKVATTAEA